jgi:O-methyltransferase involved in polyketide biosynthesis
MRAGQASRTARQNALFRALEARRPAGDRVADDPLAAAFLTPEFRLVAGAARMPPARRLIESYIDRRWPCVRGAAGRCRATSRSCRSCSGPTPRRAGSPPRASRRGRRTYGMNPQEIPGYLAGRGFTLEWDVAVSDAATRLYPAGHCPSVPAYYHVAESRRN